MRVQWQEVDNERSMTRGQQQEPRGQQQAVNNERSMARVDEVDDERSMTRGWWQEVNDKVDNEMIKYFNTTW